MIQDHHSLMKLLQLTQKKLEGVREVLKQNSALIESLG